MEQTPMVEDQAATHREPSSPARVDVRVQASRTVGSEHKRPRPRRLEVGEQAQSGAEVRHPRVGKEAGQLASGLTSPRSFNSVLNLLIYAIPGSSDLASYMSQVRSSILHVTEQ